jgi:hypothetical protein
VQRGVNRTAAALLIEAPMALEFEWDDKKGKQHLKKHHVSFEKPARSLPTLLP